MTTHSPRTPAERAATLRALTARDGIFIIPNLGRRDRANARGARVRGPGETSAGHAFSVGQDDSTLTREATLAHAREIGRATDLPVSADPATASAMTRTLSPRRFVSRARRDLPGPASKTRRTRTRSRFTRSSWPPSGSARPRPSRMPCRCRWCSRRAPRTSSSAGRIWPTRSRGCRHFRTRAPMCSTRRD